MKRSPCCKDAIYASMADGYLAGSCAKCRRWVVRINRETGKEEPLNGKPPWFDEKPAKPAAKGRP